MALITRKSFKRISECEKKALEIIKSTGDKGIFQSELWKKLGTNSREGSRISIQLEEKGLIKREKQLKNGRWTYRLYPINNEKIKIEWNTLENCPCFKCPDITKCGLGQQISPANCKKQTLWLIEIINNGKK